MSEIQFFQTVMGKRFYEGTMPSLVEQLKRLNNNIEKHSDASVAIQQIREIMFLDSKEDGTGFFMNIDKECDSETIERVTTALTSNGFGPTAEKKR